MKYEWAVVGGGIAGIVLTEILAREGHSLFLIILKLILTTEPISYV